MAGGNWGEASGSVFSSTKNKLRNPRRGRGGAIGGGEA